MMGCFSEVECLYTLPDGRGVDGFQTYDFDRDMETYRISEDGLLFRCYQQNPHPPYNYRAVFHSFSGRVNIGLTDGNGDWVSYIVVFVKGKVTSFKARELNDFTD